MYGFVGWLFGWLVDWLFGWLVGCKIHQVGGRKSFKLGIKTIKLEPKIVKIGSKRALGRVLGDLGELLGSSWLQDSFKSPKSRPTDPPRTPLDPPSWSPKSIKKMITFWIVSRSIFGRFWAPTWPPRGESTIQILEHFSILGPSWAQDAPKTPPRGFLGAPRTLQEPSWDRF